MVETASLSVSITTAWCRHLACRLSSLVRPELLGGDTGWPFAETVRSDCMAVPPRIPRPAEARADAWTGGVSCNGRELGLDGSLSRRQHRPCPVATRSLEPRTVARLARSVSRIPRVRENAW